MLPLQRCLRGTAPRQPMLLRHSARSQQQPRRFKSSLSGSGTNSNATETIAHSQPQPGLLARVGQAYSRTQKNRPYLTQIVSASAIFAAGDLAAQYIEDSGFEGKRVTRALAIGAMVAIPQQKWVAFLARNFNYNSFARSLGTKIVVNQIFWPPAINGFFFAAHGFLSGASVVMIGDKLREALPTSLWNSLKLWPAVMALTMTFVPLHHRALTLNFVAIGWQTYLSFLNKRAEVHSIEQAKATARLPVAGAAQRHGGAVESI